MRIRRMEIEEKIEGWGMRRKERRMEIEKKEEKAGDGEESNKG